MLVGIAQTDPEIAECYPVMVQLLPDLREEEFVNRIRQLMDMGYSLACVKDDTGVCAVAGFRIIEMLLSSKPYLVINEMVTDKGKRSQGYGDYLFDWLISFARKHSCGQIHLDSSVRLVDAHRFYFRKRMHIQGYHFILPL
jgi:GNAT superfamily N-acetyltransferase